MSARRVIRQTTRGAALLEVLVGLTILAWMAASWVALERQTQHSIAILRSREREYERASQQLDRVTIWTRNQFLAELGEHHLPGSVLLVEQVGPVLFRATVADSVKGSALLTTTFYRSDSTP